MDRLLALLLLLVVLSAMTTTTTTTTTMAFAPPRPSMVVTTTTKSKATTSSTTQRPMIGGFFQGMFGPKTADITETVYFDVAIAGSPAGTKKEIAAFLLLKEHYYY